MEWGVEWICHIIVKKEMCCWTCQLQRLHIVTAVQKLLTIKGGKLWRVIDEFFWRRLHSLLGVIPVGLFVVQHLIINHFATRGEEVI